MPQGPKENQADLLSNFADGKDTSSNSKNSETILAFASSTLDFANSVVKLEVPAREEYKGPAKANKIANNSTADDFYEIFASNAHRGQFGGPD